MFSLKNGKAVKKGLQVNVYLDLKTELDGIILWRPYVPSGAKRIWVCLDPTLLCLKKNKNIAVHIITDINYYENSTKAIN